MRFLRTALIICVVHAIGCSPGIQLKTLPSPAEPSEVPPVLPVVPGPIPSGSGRVTLDVVKGHANVEEVLERRSMDTTTLKYVNDRLTPVYDSIDLDKRVPVCTTPCVVDLPYGSHSLRFSPVERGDYDDGKWHEMTGTFDVPTGQNPRSVRVELASQQHETHGINLSWPGSILILGGAGAAVGALTVDDKGDAKHPPWRRRRRHLDWRRDGHLLPADHDVHHQAGRDPSMVAAPTLEVSTSVQVRLRGAGSALGPQTADCGLQTDLR